MRVRVWLLMAGLLAGCATGAPTSGPEVAPKTAALFVVAGFEDQVTGIAVTPSGRVFVNFPRWGKEPRHSVAELLGDGSLRPYPDAGWNRWDTQVASHPESHFICVQSVFADRAGYLWVLDPASPSFSGVVDGGAKLLKVNLANDAVEQVVVFDQAVLPKNGYLNDVRISPDGGTAYITDSGAGAIIVVDLKQRTVRRLLDRDPSTKAEQGFVPVVEGKELRAAGGAVPQINADGIALDSRGEYLYYHALTGRGLYRIRTADLENSSLSPTELAGRVEKVTQTGAVDGMEMGADGTLYITSLEESAVRYVRRDGTTGVVVKNKEIIWPDSLSIGPDNYLYITASQINRMPRFNAGSDRHVAPFRLFRIWLAPL